MSDDRGFLTGEQRQIIELGDALRDLERRHEALLAHVDALEHELLRRELPPTRHLSGLHVDEQVADFAQALTGEREQCVIVCITTDERGLGHWCDTCPRRSDRA